jgi:hypothetical protein
VRSGLTLTIALAALGLVVAPARAQSCGERLGLTPCPFDEGFVPCPPSCIGDIDDPKGRTPSDCRCPASRYVLTAAEVPCIDGQCPAGFGVADAAGACRCRTPPERPPPCPRRCADSTECCEDDPRTEGRLRYSQMRCWPFIDVDGDTAFDPEDEALALSALMAACDNNIDLSQRLGRLPGTYVTSAETRPGARARWECRTDYLTGDCRGPYCHVVTLTSPYGLSTPANAPNGQQFFNMPHIHLAMRLGGDFINQSCSTWKDHWQDHSWDVRARNVLLGGTMVGTEIVGDNVQQNLSFEATESCIIGGNFTGLDEARVGDLRLGELDCYRRRNGLRQHGARRDNAIVLKAPLVPGGLIDLAFPFDKEQHPRLGRWVVGAQKAGICIQAAETRNVAFDKLVHEACGVIADCGAGRRTEGSCPEDFCALPLGLCPLGTPGGP